MKKINFIVGAIFFALAVLFTIDVVWHMKQGSGWSLTSILPTIFMYCLSGVYFYLGFVGNKREQKKMNELAETYRVLMDLYDDIKNPENSKDELSKRMFITGVHDFGCIVFDVTAGMYPDKMKYEAEKMLDNLMRHVAEFV